jgi:hypothetical protein
MSPVWGQDIDSEGLGLRASDWREVAGMQLVKRVAMALGSLLALMLAGGAHYKF